MAVTPLPSKLVHSASTAMCSSLFSSGSFKLSYAPWHTSQFLSQARATTTDGFLDGHLGADPMFGTCLQCAAIDRARLKTNPVTPRSGICSGCFKKYCYDPQNPPPEGQIVGRRFKFKDPDPLGLKSFYMAHKAGLIITAIIVGVGLIATITGCVMFWWRRFQRRKIWSVAFQQPARGHVSDGSAHMGQERHTVAPRGYPVSSLEKGKRPYSKSGVGYGVPKTCYAERGYETAKTYYEEPSYETAKLHHARSSYDTGKTHYAEPSNETAKTHRAGPSYDTMKTYYEEPRNYETTKPHSARPSYDTAKTHRAGPSYDTMKTCCEEPRSYEKAKLDSARPSYDTAKTHYAEPNYEPVKTHRAGPSYDTMKTCYEEPRSYGKAKLHYARPSYDTTKVHDAESSYHSERRN